LTQRLFCVTLVRVIFKFKILYQRIYYMHEEALNLKDTLLVLACGFPWLAVILMLDNKLEGRMLKKLIQTGYLVAAATLYTIAVVGKGVSFLCPTKKGAANTKQPPQHHRVGLPHHRYGVLVNYKPL
jgi:hypothetical protein